MKKSNKKDLIYIILTIIVFLLIIITIYSNNYSYLPAQFTKEISIIDNLRTLYYSNFDLFPDFLFNLGNGQNIYYLAEYGLLNPITIISYLLPFLSIKVYLIIIIAISYIVSIILIYRFFHKKKYPSEVCFLTSLTFVISSIILNINQSSLLPSYLTFLIVAFYGVDKVFDEKKGHILTISVFLMIITNFYQSISGIICLLIYSLYRYLKHMNIITFKSFFKRLISIISPIIVALLCSSILTIPAIITISSTTSSLSSEAYIPLIFILIPSIINYLKKDKTNITISIILVSLIIISIIYNYSLISYIPLYLIIISDFFSNTLKNKLNINKLTISLIIISVLILLFINQSFALIQLILLIIVILLYYKNSKKCILITLISLIMLINPSLINKQFSDNSTNQENIQKLLYSIKENNIYRTYIDTENKNTIYNKTDYYSSTIDINNSNTLYQEFNQDILYNQDNQPNLISLILNNNKYLISESNSLQGYQELNSIDTLKLYVNKNTLPLGFATSNIMSYEDFSKLNSLAKQEALLNVIITDNESNNNFIPTTKKINLSLNEIFNQEDTITKEDSVFINAKNQIKIKYQLPDKYQNKILLIKFDVQNSRDNQTIKINNISKTISKSSHNLEYMLASTEQKDLIFTFTEGQYYLNNFEFYLLDYANIENCSEKVSPFIIESNNTKGDKIIGTIEVQKDSYFMITIPYDRGFNILVDNEKVVYEKVDEAYIGFPITEGLHSIEIEYHVPYKAIAYLLSSLGIISFITITYFESKRQFN